MVRGAGFPVSDVLALAAPATARAADAVIAAEHERDRVRDRVLAELRARRDASTGDERAELVRAIRAAEQGRHADPELAAAHAAYDAAVRAYAQTGAADEARVVDAMRRLAGEPRFREAVTWQSRSALHDGIDRWLATRETTSSKQRRRQRLLASYVQRYCAKNDSIGFFGPFGWGTFDPSLRGVELSPGPSLLARRSVYFEHWAIDVLAEALSTDELKPELAPYLLPVIALEGEVVRYPDERRTDVPRVVAELLARCDGVTPARAIAEALVADETLELSDPDEVYELLAELEERGFLTWTLDVPSSAARSEDMLAARIAQIADADLRGTARAAIDRLLAARDRVASAAGDPDRVEQALEGLDRVFVELTGEAAQRHHGETYAARGIVYEDCRRDLEARFGAVVLDRIAPVIALLGQSARWYTHEIAMRYRAALEQAHATLQATDGDRVPYTRFWAATSSLWATAQSARTPIVDAVATELGRRWTELLAAAPDERHVERDSRQLADAAARLFAAPMPGWPMARQVAPDILLAARGLEALQRGEVVPVIGEIHIGNTLLSLYVMHEHADPAQLIAAQELDLPAVQVAPIESRRMVGRGDVMSWSARDLHVALGPSRSWRPLDHVVRAADLFVERRAGQLVVGDARSGRTFDAIAFFEQYLRFAASGHFKPHPADGRRVMIDGVVVSRARWQFAPTEVPLATTTDRHDQFCVTRRWARAVGLPRFVFFKVPEETKPVYLDLESPLYVELFASLVRKATAVTLTEMSPTVEEGWLPDTSGHTYTCELRMVAVDPVEWCAPTLSSM